MTITVAIGSYRLVRATVERSARGPVPARDDAGRSDELPDRTIHHDLMRLRSMVENTSPAR